MFKYITNKIFSFVLIFSLFTFFSIAKETEASSAINSTNLQLNQANTLVTLGIIKGYEDGSLRLQNKLTRSEFITLIIKAMGYDKDKKLQDVKISFKDITEKHWAYNNIKLAIKYDLVSGYPDKTIGPNKMVTYAEALAVITKALGYEKTLSGEWPKNVLSKATELKINQNLSLDANKQITRGEMSTLIYNSLTVDFYKK